MESIRKVESISKGVPTLEGAGVRLHRIFAHNEIKRMAPFLLLDHFGSDKPEEYLAGFPWHPHRGIETVTYMIKGEVDHADSLGNSGTIRSGDIQWMTAGSGIIHQEMPRLTAGKSMGFQLWVNLPSASKMTAPKYRGVLGKEIPEVTISKGVKAKVIAGKAGKKSGPVHDLAVDVSYFDFELEPNAELDWKTDPAHTAFAYVFEGKGDFEGGKGAVADEFTLIVFGKGNRVKVKSLGKKLRFILVTGKPLKEPIAWGGPIVMNTQKELEQAFSEIRNSTFIRKF